MKDSQYLLIYELEQKKNVFTQGFFLVIIYT